jgi:hypothetical protein
MKPLTSAGLLIDVIELPNHCHISIIPLQGWKFAPGLIKSAQINPQILHTFGDCVRILTIPLTQKFVQLSTLIIQSFLLGIEVLKIVIMRVAFLHLLRSSKDQTQTGTVQSTIAKYMNGSRFFPAWSCPLQQYFHVKVIWCSFTTLIV